MSSKILSLVSREFSGWRLWEAVYILFCTVAITVISVVLGGDVLGIASAITGTLYTMLAGKGKISCYFFGIFNSAAYGYIAFTQRLYGDAMLKDIPMKRFGVPEDLAKAIVFLASDVTAGYINGVALEISGAKRCVQNPWYAYEN